MSDVRDEVLEPCPFCGGEAKHDVIQGDPEEDINVGGHFIHCTNGRCEASTNLRFACGDDPVPLLVEQWNRRTQTQPAPVSRVAELEAIAREFCERVERGEARSTRTYNAFKAALTGSTPVGDVVEAAKDVRKNTKFDPDGLPVIRHGGRGSLRRLLVAVAAIDRLNGEEGA